MRPVRLIALSLVLLTAALVALLPVLSCAGPTDATTTSATFPAPPTTQPASPGVTGGTALVPSTTLRPAPPSSPGSVPSSAVAARLERMTLEQKVAQVLLVAFDGTELTDFTRTTLTESAPGGFLLLGRNVTGEEQLRALTGSLQQTAAAVDVPGLFIAADEEGGDVMRVKDGVPRLPSARAVAATLSPEAAEELAERTADGLLSQGVNMVLAPVADVVADRESFLYGRSYGATPDVVSDYVSAVTQAYARAGLITVVKHFPGHGSASANSHTEVPVADATRAEFERTHLPPFEAAIAAGADGIMAAHIRVPAYDRLLPSSQSPLVLDDLLRDDLGFTGLVVSDDLEMAAAAGKQGRVGMATATELGEAAVSALVAGCDLLITTGTDVRRAAIEQAIVEAVEAGELSKDRLDEAVRRVLAAKEEHSLRI